MNKIMTLEEFEQTPSLEMKNIGSKLRSKMSHGVNNITLIQPLQVEENKIEKEIAKRSRYYNYPPYGLGLIGRSLKKLGYNTHLIDLNYTVLKFIHDELKDEINPETLEKKWKDHLLKSFETNPPDLICVTCMFTMTHPVMLKIVEFSKSKLPNVPIIAGGVHITNAAKIVLNETDNIDFLSLYEGDEAFCTAIEVGCGKLDDINLSQIATKIDNKFVGLNLKKPIPPQSLDAIPDYQSLPIHDYSRLGEIGTFRFWRSPDARGAPILANRGCRAACTFCSVRNFNGKSVRGRSSQSVIDEIKKLYYDHQVNHLTWLDDDLFYNVPHMIELFNGIAKLPFKVTWDASNGIIASAATAHPELVDAASDSGCIGMYFGIESGNRDILRSVRKPSGIKHYMKIGDLMSNYPHIFTRGFLMMGFPNETISQIIDTVQLARDMNLDWYTFQLLTPLQNTDIHQEMLDLGLVEQDDLHTEGDGFTMFSVREGERQRRRERKNKKIEKESYFDLFNAPKDHIPTKPELNDIWLRGDYEINYGRLQKIDDKIKLKKIKVFLEEIADRITIGHPLALHALEHINLKLGLKKPAQERSLQKQKLLNKSIYWSSRFEKLNLI